MSRVTLGLDCETEIKYVQVPRTFLPSAGCLLTGGWCLQPIPYPGVAVQMEGKTDKSACCVVCAPDCWLISTKGH